MSKNNKLLWKKAKSLEEVNLLIDKGVLLNWNDMNTLKRCFDLDQQKQIIAHLTKRLCERVNDRLAAEIIVESLLIWFANHTHEDLINAFIDQIFDEANHSQTSKLFAEIALTSDVSEQNHDFEIFSMAVVLTCELGIAIFDYDKDNPGSFVESKEIVNHIATYLLSVSNLNNYVIRLSLLHYFGYTFTKDKNTSFNRVINRFGHSTMDRLFTLLFSKKSEAVSLQFLKLIVPFILQADDNAQRILHETFKYYMLKKPERFSLFLQNFSDHLILEADKDANSAFISHLGALFKVSSDVNHKQLCKSIMLNLVKFEQNKSLKRVQSQLQNDPTIKPAIKILINEIERLAEKSPEGASVIKLKSNKRGRRPSFAKSDKSSLIEQVLFLGNRILSKAS